MKQSKYVAVAREAKYVVVAKEVKQLYGSEV